MKKISKLLYFLCKKYKSNIYFNVLNTKAKQYYFIYLFLNKREKKTN